jgi:hypothetical protein
VVFYRIAYVSAFVISSALPWKLLAVWLAEAHSPAGATGGR